MVNFIVKYGYYYTCVSKQAKLLFPQVNSSVTFLSFFHTQIVHQIYPFTEYIQYIKYTQYIQ